MSAPNKNGKLAFGLAGLTLTMLALSFAAVPFYNWFCRVTGFGGVTQEASAPSERVLDKTIKVRFDGSLEKGMPWEFKPVAHEMELKIGETGLASYEAYNPTDEVIAGELRRSRPEVKVVICGALQRLGSRAAVPAPQSSLASIST